MPPEGSSSSLPPDGQERPAGSSDVTSSRLAGARSGAPCASEQQSSSITATTAPTAAMSRAKTGAAAPHPTHHLVWRLLARAQSAASWAGSFGASWCSADVGRSLIPHACALRRLQRASNRRCSQLYPPAARQDCGSGGIASRCRALLTRPQIGSGGRLLRRRSELWWWPRGAAYERHQISAHEPRSSANVETSSLHREAPFDDSAGWDLSLWGGDRCL